MTRTFRLRARRILASNDSRVKPANNLVSRRTKISLASNRAAKASSAAVSSAKSFRRS